MENDDSRSRTSSASTSGLEFQTTGARQSFSIQNLLAPVGVFSQYSPETPKSGGAGCSSRWKHPPRLPTLQIPPSRKTRVTSALPEEVSRSIFQRIASEDVRGTHAFPSLALNSDGAGSLRIERHVAQCSEKANIPQGAAVVDDLQKLRGQEALSPSMNSNFALRAGWMSYGTGKLAPGELSLPILRDARPSAPESEGSAVGKGIRGYWETVLISSSPCSDLRGLESSIDKKRKGLLHVWNYKVEHQPAKESESVR